MKDVTSKLEDCITKNDLFNFDGADIGRMRVELYNVIAHVTNAYRNHRILPTISNQNRPLDDDDEDDDEDEAVVMSDPEDNNCKDDDNSDGSEWNPPQDSDQDQGDDTYDHLLEADFSGKHNEHGLKHSTIIQFITTCN